MKAAEQLAHFSGGTDDLAPSGLWYSHKRVAELVQAAKAEAWDLGYRANKPFDSQGYRDVLNPYRQDATT